MGSSWNLSNVGAAADPVAAHYGIALAAVGLFTTVLFLAELASMAAIGRLVARHGAKLVGIACLALIGGGNALTLLTDSLALALALRFAVGFAVGIAFVAGTAYVQHLGGGPLAQGVYGGLSLGTAGLAVAITPSLEGSLGWRAPFASALVVAAVAIPVAAAGSHPEGARPLGTGFARLLGNPTMLRFAALQSAAFGLAIVLSNWVVPLLTTRGGYEAKTAGLIGALILATGIAARPLGGALAHRRPRATRELLVGSVLLGSAGTLALGFAPAPALAIAAALMLGTAAGLPFGPTVASLGRAFPEFPGAAFGAMNFYALLMVVIGTPLVGLTFDLPGAGLIGFAAAACYWALVALLIPDSRTLAGERNPQRTAAAGAA